MKILTIPALAIALSVSAGAAYADHHEGHKMRHDGPMTKAEFLKKAEERFDKMDADKDGTVTKDERKASMKKMWEKHGKKGKMCDKHKKHKKRDHAKSNSMNEQFKSDMRDEPTPTPKGENNVEAKRVLKR